MKTPPITLRAFPVPDMTAAEAFYPPPDEPRLQGWVRDVLREKQSSRAAGLGHRRSLPGVPGVRTALAVMVVVVSVIGSAWTALARWRQVAMWSGIAAAGAVIFALALFHRPPPSREILPDPEATPIPTATPQAAAVVA